MGLDRRGQISRLFSDAMARAPGVRLRYFEMSQYRAIVTGVPFDMVTLFGAFLVTGLATTTSSGINSSRNTSSKRSRRD
jgi:hypothetical protein